MSTTLWLSGFSVFLLGSFHLLLSYVERSRLHLLLGLGWTLNIAYLVLENEAVNNFVPSEAPFAFFLIVLAFFFLSEAKIARRPAKQVAILLSLGYGCSLFLLLGGLTWHWPFWITTSAGSAFSAAAFWMLGRSCLRVPNSEGNRFITEDNITELSDATRIRSNPLSDRFVDSLLSSSTLKVALGKYLLAFGFLGFGALQLLYPLGGMLKGADPLVWRGLFFVGMAFKLVTGLAFGLILRARIQLVEARVRQASLSEELAKITASVEHDLRAPIRQFGMTVQALRAKYQHDSHLVARLNELERTRARIKAVMDLILSMREDDGSYQRRSTRVDINSIIQRSATAAKSLYTGQEPIVKLELPQRSALVFGYPERLTQAVTNLLTNAFDARLAKGSDVRPTAYVSARESLRGRQVEIAVRDEGVGIPTEDLPFIKEAYFSTKGGGENPNRGLGLFTVNRIVQLHGGTLTIESKPGEGTTAMIELPTASRSE